MHRALTSDQVDTFNANGYCFPIDCLTTEEALRYRRELEAVESRSLRLRTDLHLIKRWAWDLIHDPRIVDPVADVLGPNILCWSLNWFIKEPGENSSAITRTQPIGDSNLTTWSPPGWRSRTRASTRDR